MAVIATFWTRPAENLRGDGVGAVGQDLERSGGSRRRPNDSGVAPKPFGTISATGTSPARTAASAAARVYAGAPGFSCGARRHVEALLGRERRDEAPGFGRPVLVDDARPGSCAWRRGRPPKTPAKTEKKTIGRTKRQDHRRAVVAQVEETRFFATARIAYSRSSRPVRWRKTCSSVGLFKVRSRTEAPRAWKVSSSSPDLLGRVRRP